MSEKAVAVVRAAMEKQEKKATGEIFSIEIDCPPGNPRPGDLLADVLKDTGIVLNPEKPAGKFFGSWTWEIPEDQIEHYKTVRETVKNRITALYHKGTIRYGSW